MTYRPQKWTREEDESLMKGVQKYGTSWAQIENEFVKNRTRNAIVKRWHGKLKQLDGDISKLHKFDEDLENNQAAQPGLKQFQESMQSSLSNQNSYKYTKQWKKQDDDTLKDAVVKLNNMDWKSLASLFNVNKQQVMNRWQSKIYPRLIQTHKIAGSLKWSEEEDMILVQCQKIKGQDWGQILQFLPSRSVYSIQGRWRRVIKKQPYKSKTAQDKQNKKNSTNKYEYRKIIIKQIASKISKC